MKGNSIRYTLFSTALLLVLLAGLRANGSGAGRGNGYRIEIEIKGIPDTVCYLANYYGDKTYLVDTAYAKTPGKYIFEGDSVLPGGIYILAGQNNNKYLELLIDQEQEFSLKTTFTGIPGDLKFKGSRDNSLFYTYVNENIHRRKQIEAMQHELGTLPPDSDSVILINDRITDIYAQLEQYEDSLIRANPDSFVSVILKAKQEPEAESPRYLENGKVDSVFAYQSYKKHYWDNLDPGDDRLLRTPLYHSRLKKYFEEVLYQNPDTLIREADAFISRTGGNSETFKYAVWYLTYKFETSNVMGFDEIFVHMVDDYYAKGLAYWSDSSVVRSLENRADELRGVLIGSQAPNMILIDTSGTFKSLYALDARYTLILFYEYGCSHCRKEIAALKAWEKDYTYDLDIFAVCTDTALVAWKNFVRKEKLDWVNVNGTRSVTPDYHILYDINVTPTIYLLDERKKIIAKRLKTDQLIPFLERYDKNHGS